MRYEGEPQPPVTAADCMATQVWSLLSNGMGGMDWSGLPLAVEWLGIDDMAALMVRLEYIKKYTPPKEPDDHSEHPT